MPIIVKCEQCGQELIVKDEMVGQLGKCPKCLCVQTILSLEIDFEPAPQIPVATVPPPEVPVATVAPVEAPIASVWKPIEETPPRIEERAAPEEEVIIVAEIIEQDERLTETAKRDDARPAALPPSALPKWEYDEASERLPSPLRRSPERQEATPGKKKKRKAIREGWGKARLCVQLNMVSMHLYAVIWGAILFDILIGGCMGLLRAFDVSATLGTIVVFLCWGLMIALWVVALIGYIFGIMTPGNNGEKGLAIAATVLLGLLLLSMFGVVLTTHAALAGSLQGRQVLENIDGLLITCFMLEVARNLVFAFYLRSLGVSLRDSGVSDAGMGLTILVPVVAVGVPLFDYLFFRLVLLEARAKNAAAVMAIILIVGTCVAFLYLCLAYASRLRLARDEIEDRF